MKDNGATAKGIIHVASSVSAIAGTIARLHRRVTKWSGPEIQMDSSGAFALCPFISGSADGPIEAVR